MFFHYIALLTGLLIVTPIQSQEIRQPYGDPAYISPDARLEIVFNDGLVLTESPAEGPDGMIYFSDITFTTSAGPDGVEAGHIWRFDPTTGNLSLIHI